MACTVVAELGINHQGDLRTAKQLISAAAHAGADLVKLQKRMPELCVPEGQRDVPKDTPWGRMSYLDYKRRMEFGKADYFEIDRYCAELGIGWFLSVWDLPSLEFALPFRPPYLKIPSALLTDEELVTGAAGAGVPLILSTGMSTTYQIRRAVDWAAGAPSLTLLHCHSAYPAPSAELNLRCIQQLRTDHPDATIGYSGHEYGLEPTVWAVVLGAEMVERHICLRHSDWGSDQLASVEVPAFGRLVTRIRSAEAALGDGHKRVWESEQTAMQRLRPNAAPVGG
jgi:N-acetylneuraminate synthase